MKILFVASEARPFIASGGLADVAGSLPKALCDSGNECRVVIPLYKNIPQQFREKMEFVRNFNVPLAWRNQYCGVFKMCHQGVVYYFLDNEYYFKRDNLYGYYDDAERFAFFSKASMEMLNYIDYDPDIVHTNDWHTALVPVYLNTFYRSIPKYHDIKTVFTIHNIQYQGQYGMEIAWDVLGIPEYQHPILEYNGCLNMMKAAIVQVNVVNTVSPSYAVEIHDPWFSHGLDPILNMKGNRVIGILNGIDVAANDPKTDQDIYKNYDIKTLEDKKVNKAELMKEMGLEPNEDRMLIGMVTRFASHKGLDLVKYIFDDLMRDNVSVVVLGSGEKVYEDFFREMQYRYAGRMSVKIGFLPALSKKIYAGADVFLMPSKSEPCGLAQMVAARYGTLPIVRETGGLKDSIHDMGTENGNGFTFKTYNAHDMLGAIQRAEGLYGNKPLWKDAMTAAMSSDFSWDKSAGEYVRMYQMIMQD
ncbi:MAG: glycogen synthase GlgA [Negativibacillus sp.]|nr:glycogen synthase GlgA [Negativibacillus sp.]